MKEKVKNFILGQDGGVVKLINLIPLGFFCLFLLFFIIGVANFESEAQICLYISLTFLVIGCLTAILFNLKNFVSTIAVCLHVIPLIYFIWSFFYFGEV